MTAQIIPFPRPKVVEKLTAAELFAQEFISPLEIAIRERERKSPK